MSRAARVDSIAADMSGQSLASPCRSWRCATISRSVSFLVMVLVLRVFSRAPDFELVGKSDCLADVVSKNRGAIVALAVAVILIVANSHANCIFRIAVFDEFN